MNHLQPDHARVIGGAQVVTIFLDKKQGWGSAEDRRTPRDLDALIQSIIPRFRLFTPADLKGNYPTLRAAAHAGAWPQITEMRNRIILVLTAGGKLPFPGNGGLAKYVLNRREKTLIFVAPATENDDGIVGPPDDFDVDQAKWVVYHNIEEGDEKLGRGARRPGRVTRIWSSSVPAPRHSSACQLRRVSTSSPC